MPRSGEPAAGGAHFFQLPVRFNPDRLARSVFAFRIDSYGPVRVIDENVQWSGLWSRIQDSRDFVAIPVQDQRDVGSLLPGSAVPSHRSRYRTADVLPERMPSMLQ